MPTRKLSKKMKRRMNYSKYPRGKGSMKKIKEMKEKLMKEKRG